MRTSQFLLATLKETPADAEIVSHRLMLRAGMIRRVAAGIYNWLPLGLRVMRRVEKIVREEMDQAGAQELLMPAVQPGELWQESGRWEEYGPELLRFQDRHSREFCFGPTHEEVITLLVRNEIRSYRQLPANFYQIQTKFRDEIRPRFGVMRAREFVMKDAYSFHTDQASLQETYDRMHAAYSAVFRRCGLEFRAVRADSGAIGGSMSHEFHVLADSGEDAIAFSTESDYATNVEMADAVTDYGERAEPGDPIRQVDTPNAKTIAQLVEQFGLPIEKTIKTLVVEAAEEVGGGLVALLVRGDHELNALKAEKLPQVASPLRMANEAEIREAIGAGPGSLGPVNLPIPCVIDRAVATMSDFGAGANIDHQHYFDINWERDVALPEVADIRNVQEGDPSPDGQGTITIARGIEVGHIFQLGDKYSRSMDATVLDESGKAVIMPMGCYGIGITRVVAAAIEQHHDDKGIVWPAPLAPYDVCIVPIGLGKSEAVTQAAEDLYQKLQVAGFEVLLDDRSERPGVMFADMELIGIPHRLVIGARGLENGIIEYRNRASGEDREIAMDLLVETLQAMQ